MPLTKSPFRVINLLVHLTFQFTRHLVETLDRIRYAIHRFEALTYDLVDRDPGKCELRTNSVNPTSVRAKEGTHTNGGKQGISPQVASQFCLCPLS